jgi:hypothetical protein
MKLAASPTLPNQSFHRTYRGKQRQSGEFKRWLPV